MTNSKAWKFEEEEETGHKEEKQHQAEEKHSGSDT
jgi:hypothetical protein